MALRAIQSIAGIGERALAILMLVVGAGLLYLLAFDQGQILSHVLGQSAYQHNYLHEFFHDGRHLFGFACH